MSDSSTTNSFLFSEIKAFLASQNISDPADSTLSDSEQIEQAELSIEQRIQLVL